MGLCDPQIAPLDRFPCVCKDISSSAAKNLPKISPIIRLLAVQLCKKFEESGTFRSRDMGLCDPQIAPLDRVSCVCKDISSSAA